MGKGGLGGLEIIAGALLGGAVVATAGLGAPWVIAASAGGAYALHELTTYTPKHSYK